MKQMMSKNVRKCCRGHCQSFFRVSCGNWLARTNFENGRVWWRILLSVFS